MLSQGKVLFVQDKQEATIKAIIQQAHKILTTPPDILSDVQKQIIVYDLHNYYGDLASSLERNHVIAYRTLQNKFVETAINASYRQHHQHRLKDKSLDKTLKTIDPTLYTLLLELYREQHHDTILSLLKTIQDHIESLIETSYDAAWKLTGPLTSVDTTKP